MAGCMRLADKLVCMAIGRRLQMTAYESASHHFFSMAYPDTFCGGAFGAVGSGAFSRFLG